MAQPSHQESLLKQIEALEPHFGRARDDIRALVTRARGADHKGVLQNTRLVVETLLRTLIAKKKQTPGRQTLDQLVSKLQSELPTHISVHVRTIQAWGNVSAHDHGADLFDEGLSVSDQEVTAALNALVPILTWYRDTHLEETPSAPAAPAAPAPAPTSEPGAKGKLAFALVGLVGLVGVGVFMMSNAEDNGAPPPKPAETKRAPAPPAPPALADFYRAQDVAPPPAQCRTRDAARLETLGRAAKLLMDGKPKGARPEDTEALKILQAAAAEGDDDAERLLLTAYAHHNLGAPVAEVLAAASAAEAACPTASAALNLHGKLLFHRLKVLAAIKKFEAAAAAAPRAGGPRVNLALALVQRGDEAKAQATLDTLITDMPEYAPGYRTRAALAVKKKDHPAARADLEQATRLDPEDGKAWVLLARVRLELGDAEGATKAFCEAKAHGIASAAPLCK